MKILFIAFELPPLATGGVQRSIKFIKYLPDFGIQPVVVTTDLDSFRQFMPDGFIDESLLEQLPPDLVIERVPCTRLKATKPGKFAEWRRIYFSLVEDLAEQWWPRLATTLPHLIAKHKPQAIYVTMPPFCMGPLGCKIARQYNLPLVLDLRDAWSQWCTSPYGSWLHYWLKRRLEGQCLRAAGRLVCTSNQTRADFLQVHPDIPADKINVITNGYDQPIDDWTPEFHPNGKRFEIGYVGSFYYSPLARETMMRPWWRKQPNRMIQYAPRKEDWLYRSPFFFFRAVARLLDKQPSYRQRLRIRFAGRKPDWIDAQVAQFNLEGLVEFVGQLDHAGALKFQRECDALLVTSSKVIGGRDYSIAGKTFEYFSMKKPIIGFVAEGAQKELLATSGMALICDPDAPEAAAEQLGDLVEGRLELKPNVRFLKQLHRRELTGRLAEIIKSVAKQPVL
jgi:glycosyltransferase involved in cell wall biosynthesis